MVEEKWIFKKGSHITCYEYNSNKQKNKTYLKRNYDDEETAGANSRSHITTYTYGSNGNLISEHCERVMGDWKKIENTTLYKYDSNNNVIFEDSEANTSTYTYQEVDTSSIYKE